MIGRLPVEKFTSANHMHLPDLGSDASAVWNFWACFSGETSGGVAKCRLFSSVRIAIKLEKVKQKSLNITMVRAP